MADLTPEMRSRLEALRARIEAGDMSDEELQRAGQVIQQIRNQSAGGIAFPNIPKPRPTSVEEITGGFVNRPAFEMAGGAAGALVGGGTTAPTGPGAIAGAMAGGGLGAAAGSALFDNTNDVLRFLDILATPPDATSGFERAGDIALRAGQAGFEDAVFAAGGQVVGELVTMAGKPLMGRLLGLRTEEAQRVIQAAEAQGISIGATTAAEGLVGRGAKAVSRILGVFPFMGPVREGAGRQFVGVKDRVLTLVDNYGPNTIMRDQLGIDMVEAARGARSEFVRVSGELYNNARQLSASAGHPKIIPTANIRQLADETAAAREAGTLFDQAGQPISQAVDDKVGDFLTSLQNLEDTVSFAQFENISNQMRDLVGILSKEGFDVSRIAQLRGAMETSIRSIDLGPSGQFDAFDPRPAIVEAMERADRFYSQNIGTFRTPTAQRFGRVDRNIMRPGAISPGSINADQAADIVVNLQSAEAVADLRLLIGDEVMDAAARGFLDDALQNSLKDGLPDATLLRNSLGLTGPQRGRVRESALREFLGEDAVNNLKTVADILERIPEVPNASKFIQRRTVLGGVRSLLGGTTLIAGAGLFGDAGVGTTLLLAYLARRGGNMLTNPDQLRLLTRVLGDQNATEAQRRALLGRLMEANGDLLAIDVTGPADAASLTMKEAMENPQVRFIIDFVTRREATSLGEDTPPPLTEEPLAAVPQ